jgi:hypothetical protein
MELVAARAEGNLVKEVAFWQDHLKDLISAYRMHMRLYDRDELLRTSVQALDTGDNTREMLAWQVMVMVDMMARAK